MRISYTDAILKLRPEAAFTIKDDEYDTFQWFDTVQEKPSEDEIKVQVELMKNQWVLTEYQRQRKMEYPNLEELADAIYWQSNGDSSKMTEYLEKVSLIKEKYPKN